jgi:hypothetical protein
VFRICFALLAIMASSSKGCTSKVNTVKKWKETLNANWLEYDDDGKVESGEFIAL